MKETKIVQFGVGPIGATLVKYALQKEGIKLVGAVDIDKNKVGKDLGELTLGKKLGLPITDDADRLLARTMPDVVLHSTGSYLKDVKTQLLKIIDSGTDLISTCEELSYPFLKHPDISKELDKRACKNGVTVLGTGVNPGFVMDSLVIMSTGVCQEVKKIRSNRIQDASVRRLPFQKKIGAGLSPDEFKAKVAEGTIKHVGFAESIAMIASALGWSLDRIDEKVEPKIAEKAVASDYIKVEPGQVAGVNQTAWGIRDGEQAITLNLQAYLGCSEPREEIVIDGQPPVHLIIEGGIHGDLATAAVVVNSIPRVIGARPGFVTMKDLPLPSAWFGELKQFMKKV
ncbi:MAG TPA: dihydrodipicolinate reductase [Candidatus Bathyarchaeia archaeon]|nr:dihydrodipicolinate reductase [Candidatus Bathyarchaeia archaeon]